MKNYKFLVLAFSLLGFISINTVNAQEKSKQTKEKVVNNKELIEAFEAHKIY